MLLKYGPEGPVGNKPALAKVMAWHRTGDQSLHEPMLTQIQKGIWHH